MNPGLPAVLACGAWLKNAACLLEDGQPHWSPLHGDLGDPAACVALERSLDVLLAQSGAPLQAVAHDLHPDFHSSRLAVELAERLGVPAVGVQHHHAHIAAVMAEEMGKRLEEARGDIQEAIDTAYYAGAEGRRLFGHTAPSELPAKMGFTLRRPIGVVGVITAWNFPVAVPSWKILPALVCGNTVVWKPSEQAPESGAMFAQALLDAGVPGGALNVVHGLGEEVGEAIVGHADTQVLAFTGSTAVGKRIAEVGGRRLKRVSLELGGKNPVIVMPDADIELAVDGILWGAFGTAGQRCTATSRVICVGDVKARLLPRLLERTAALRLGDPRDPAVQVGPVVSARQQARIHEFVQTALREGATLRCGAR